MEAMELYHIVYISRPFGFDQALLNGLLVDSRANNERDDITGALICRADLYLQLLEGPQKQVMKTFARIENDDRHTEVDVLISERTLAREFPHWSMLDDPARTWLWTQSEIASGAAIKASKGEVLSVFKRLRSEI